MKSILNNELECYICGATDVIHRHHIYFGANRKVSDQHGFWVYLCLRHHTGSNNSVHHNRQLDLKLKEECQKKYEETHTREEFRALIGRSYL